MAREDPKPKLAREAYEPMVCMFVPCDGEELKLRSGMMLMRDRATERLRHCSDEAAGVLLHVQRLGLEYALASMPLERLAEMRRNMVRLVATASALEGWVWEGRRVSGR